MFLATFDLMGIYMESNFFKVEKRFLATNITACHKDYHINYSASWENSIQKLLNNLSERWKPQSVDVLLSILIFSLV